MASPRMGDACWHASRIQRNHRSLVLPGEDMVDSVWPHAVRSLEWTMALRASSATTLSLFFFAALAGYGLRAFVNSTGCRSPSALPYAVVGALLALISLHFLLDVFYLRGAFLFAAHADGVELVAAALVGLGGPPSLRSPGQDRISSVRLFQLFRVFFCRLVGDARCSGRGRFCARTPRHAHHRLRLVSSSRTRSPSIARCTPCPMRWLRYRATSRLTLSLACTFPCPTCPRTHPCTHLPLAVLLHGFGYPDADAYESWITHLGAKGMAVAFIQYPSDLRPEGHEQHEASYANGTSTCNTRTGTSPFEQRWITLTQSC